MNKLFISSLLALLPCVSFGAPSDSLIVKQYMLRRQRSIILRQVRD